MVSCLVPALPAQNLIEPAPKPQPGQLDPERFPGGARIAPAQQTETPTEPDFPLSTPVEAVSGNPQPLDFSGKLDYYIKGMTSLETFGRLVGSTAFNHFVIGPDGFSNGIGGAGERFASRYAETAMRRTLQFGIGAARGEDPRFFRSSDTGTWDRVKFQMRRTVLVQMDNGSESVAVGKLTGFFVANAASATWQPVQRNPWREGLQDTGVSLGTDLGYRLLREFWPDIKSKFKK
jgi:hypothetical protein